jgi:sugar phosphate isomerase/epimerase
MLSAAGIQAWAEAPLAWPHPIGLQIYTVRDAYKQDPLGTLKKVRAAGYQQIELINLDSIPADTLKGYIRQAGLDAISGHFPLPKEDSDWAHQVDIAQQLGLSYMVIPFAVFKTADEWKALAKQLNKLGRMCADKNIQLAYHNHIFEFRPQGSTTGYKILMDNTDPHLLKMEMDLFWATYAHQNPLQWFHEYPGRFPLLHLKDLKKQLPAQDQNPYEFPKGSFIPFTEVGQGRIDWRPIFAHVKEAGTKYVFVEQDRSDIDPFKAIAMSAKYIKNLRMS